MKFVLGPRTSAYRRLKSDGLPSIWVEELARRVRAVMKV